jgi:hypothetical protein
VKTKIIEACHVNKDGEQTGNWGKFFIGRFDAGEWATPSQISGFAIGGRGWSEDHLFVMDLQTGEGALFRHGGFARADLNKHRIWVCPLFEPFLTWLYKQDVSDLDALPALITFDPAEAEFSMAGYRRPGREG